MKCLLYLVTGTLLFLSCKKDPAPGLPVVHIDPAIVSYLGDIQGKYRVFKDSASGIEDSVQVIFAFWENVDIPEFVGPSGENFPAHQTQRYNLYMESTSIGYFASGTGYPLLTLGVGFIDTAGLSITQDMEGHLMASFARNSLLSAEDISLFGQQFNDVVKFEFDNETYKEDFLWARGIGIILRRVTTPDITKTQYLVRYN